MPRNRRLIPQAVLTPVLAVLAGRDNGPAARRPSLFKPNLSVLNKADNGPAVLRIYDAIGGWWGITASDVAELLDDIADTRDLTVRINSPGGDVFDGTAIYNLLATRAGQVDVIVDGLAASAASFIAQAGDTITMNRGTQMMIHDASGFTIGNANDHRITADLLDGVSDEIAGIYAARSGVSKAEWRNRMQAETWYNAEAAVEAGLADQTADAGDDQDDQDEEEQAAAARGRPKVAAALGFNSAHTGNVVLPSPVTEVTEDGDLFGGLGDDELGGIAAVLDEVFDPMAGYDPDLLASTILDTYADAPAPPPVPEAPPTPRTTISVYELIEAIQEGVRP